MGATLGIAVNSINANDHPYDWEGTEFHDVVCQWSGPSGPVTMEARDDPYAPGTHKAFTINGWSREGQALDGLGVKAFTGTTGGEQFVAWAAGLDDRDRTISFRGSVPVDALVALAHIVDGSASPGTEAAPEGGTSQGAEALLGTWTLTSAAADPAPADPVVTLTFGADGTWVLAIDCKPPKGKKAFSWTDTYTADATTVDMAPASFHRGAGKGARNFSDFIQPFSFTLALATQPGSWTNEGDVLSITGGPGVTLEFQRAAP